MAWARYNADTNVLRMYRTDGVKKISNLMLGKSRLITMRFLFHVYIRSVLFKFKFWMVLISIIVFVRLKIIHKLCRSRNSKRASRFIETSSHLETRNIHYNPLAHHFTSFTFKTPADADAHHPKPHPNRINLCHFLPTYISCVGWNHLVKVL